MTKLTILHISNCFLSFFLHWPQTKKEHFIHFFLSHIHLHYSYHQFSHTSIFIKRLIFCAIVCSYLRLQTFQRISFSIQARKKTLFFPSFFFILFRNKMKCDVGNIVTIYSNAIFWALFIHIYTN